MTTSADGSGPRILVIEDDETILGLIEAVLMEEGFTVDAALSGQQALDLDCSHSPAMVVLDMFLPGISGAELAEALRAKYGAGLPILVTSASNVRAQARALGAHYLPKPFELVDLMEAVHQALHETDGAR